MMKKPGIDISKVRVYTKRYANIFKQIPQIKKSMLGDFGGIYGALAKANRI
jgi:hypothetical protein